MNNYHIFATNLSEHHRNIKMDDHLYRTDAYRKRLHINHNEHSNIHKHKR